MSLYDNDMDTALVCQDDKTTDNDNDVMHTVGLHRLVLHAHSRCSSVQGKILRQCLTDLQDIECPYQRERLIAVASEYVSQPAVCAATQLAQ